MKVDSPSLADVKQYFMALQDSICAAMEEADGEAKFSREEVENPSGGIARPRILDNGRFLERGAVQFSHSVGDALPPAASERNPQLAGLGFEAVAISMIMHPRNPYAPTFHANLRFFLVNDEHWHFGGGFDLTPFYPFTEDVLHWHRTARAACEPFGDDLYYRLKTWCDEYFYLSHRQEPRGVGGLFYDDWRERGFAGSFALTSSIGDHILPAYLPILERRKDLPYGEREREFQLYRRGRYAEFNLAIDRGTRYGIQSGRRIESVLASMPPMATWKYNWQPEPGSPESVLYDDFLKPRDWLAELT
ncbi:MAG: oxygen-dependent coproporphyrinogen oxidase [Gammaproteobacteria bacterium]|jgi:coproporphyrinogen III oxidase|nr:oxygen-dependent coproporphyrinogen oxidase [Gammaproteobacteria bacterium]MBT4494791.1 oxygen-dependent coproporphyrinogen oxidase [Gammaproteobacteria bacterium]MBT7371137.1 oxygen-dependent coproporphyrinogen oxidase [Gammaproteobacteria bacterium]